MHSESSMSRLQKPQAKALQMGVKRLACRGTVGTLTPTAQVTCRAKLQDMNGSLGKTLRSYVSPSLLLLDELGYLPIDKHGADLLFQIVAARYEVGSIVITTNRPFREWGLIFDVDNTLATALIDRLMHHGEGIVIQGDSYRMKDKDPDSTDE